MIRLSTVMGVLLTLGIGLAATVLAQAPSKPRTTTGKPASASPAQGPPPTASSASLVEYEVRIWKDGVPVTPTMGMKATPGDTSHIKIPDGTLYVRFQPHESAAEARWDAALNQEIAKALTNGLRTGSNDQLLKAQNPGANPNTKNHDELFTSLSGFTTLEPGEAKDVSEVLARIGKRQGVAAKDDHEQRLLEIERKLEKILNALSRSDASDPATTTKPRAE